MDKLSQSQQTEEKLRSQLASCQNEEQKLSDQLADKQDSENRLKDELTYTNKMVEELQGRLEELRGRLQEYQDQDQVHNDRSEEEKRLAAELAACRENEDALTKKVAWLRQVE
jgi:septal ring factor EnvC (AmiA/AmiB activator)